MKMQLTGLATILSILLACHAVPVPEGETAKATSPLPGNSDPPSLGGSLPVVVKEALGGSLVGALQGANHTRDVDNTPRALPKRVKICLETIAIEALSEAAQITQTDVNYCLKLKVVTGERWYRGVLERRAGADSLTIPTVST